MPNAWFRFYHEWDSDPKVQMMSEAMQRRLAMLFCWRCRNETFQETRAAFHWRITPEELAQTKAIFMANEFIDENWNLLNWNRRQFLSDSSTDRVRRHRQGLKQDETLHETVAPVTVTPPDTDTDADTKKEQKPSPKPRKRGSEGPTKTALAKSRHDDFKEAIRAYWNSKNPDLGMPWGKPEGRNLEMWLKENPTITIEQFKGFLRNRFRSDVAHGDRPSKWIFNVTSYANGPLNQFNKPLVHINGAPKAISEPTAYDLKVQEFMAERRAHD